MSTIRRALVVVLALGLIAAASAVAASPKAGHYSGFTSETAINGFKAPVRFRVSGGKIRGFKWAGLGCSGGGGFGPGDPWKKFANLTHPVGTFKISQTGSFTVTGRKSSYSRDGYTTTTISSVTGTFTGQKKASGMITVSQVYSGKYHGSCGPASLTFSVKRS